MSGSGGSIFEVLQNILEAIGFGNAGDVLTSRGASKFPTFQSGGVGNVGAGALVQNLDEPSIVNLTDTILSFSTVSFDDLGFFSVGDPTKLTIPAGVSRVAVSARVDFNANATGIRRIKVNKNGVVVAESLTLSTDNAGASFPTVLSGTFEPINVVAGDFFTLVALQGSGAGLILPVIAFGITVIRL